jgi:alpha-galactosidase
LGTVGWGHPHSTRLSPDEQYLHFSLWCLFSSPLLIGCDMEKLDPFTLNLLTNDEVIALDQDPLGKQATCIDQMGELRVYVKELSDGSRAVGFCNFGREAVDLPYKNLTKLGCTGSQKVRDLWRQTDLGSIDAGKDVLPLKVPVHGITLYKFTPVQ